MMISKLNHQLEHVRRIVTPRPINNFLDNQRMEFLRRLHRSGITLNPWEQPFVTDFVASPRGFDANQRAAVDEMMDKYERRLS